MGKKVLSDTKQGDGVRVSPLLPGTEKEIFIPNLKVNFAQAKEVEAKKLKKIQYIPLRSLLDLRDGFRIEDFIRKLKNENLYAKQIFYENRRLHNVIDRRTGTTPKEGSGVYGRPEIWIHNYLWLFVYWPYEEEVLKEILSYIETVGYGADKSSGAGKFTVMGISQLEPDLQRELFTNEGNAVVLLCDCIPKSADEFLWDRSFYRVKMKVGRLGEGFAHLRPYYKRPLWFIEAGSVMMPRDMSVFYGRLVEHVHTLEEIDHYGISFGVTVNLLE